MIGFFYFFVIVFAGLERLPIVVSVFVVGRKGGSTFFKLILVDFD